MIYIFLNKNKSYLILLKRVYNLLKDESEKKKFT